MIRKLARLGPKLLLFCSICLIGLSEKASAVTYIYRNSPDGAWATCYSYTSTTSVTVVSVDYYSPEWGCYIPTSFGYYDSGEYTSGYKAIVKSYYKESGTMHSASKVLLSGLTPATSYSLNYGGYTYFYYNGTSSPLGYLTVTTEPNAPTNPTFSGTGQSTTNVNWTTNGNGNQATYKLYRGSSSSGPWALRYSGTGTFFSESGLASETTYFFKVTSSVPGGSEVSSSVVSVTTSADPAVAAAQAAKGASEAAMLSAEAAKIAAMQSNTEVQSLRTEFQAFAAADNKDPVIASFVYSVPKATITSLSTVNYCLIATDSTALQYRYKINDGSYTGWTNLTAETVSIALGTTPGIKRVTIQVVDSGGNTDTATATIFKI